MKKFLTFILLSCWITPVAANGLYLGGYVDYGNSNISIEKMVDMDASGFLGGVHAGYDIPLGRFFVGIEGDMSFGNLDNTIKVNEDGIAAGLTQSIKGLYSLRGRLGLNLGSIQLYGTAGTAWVNLETDLHVTTNFAQVSSISKETMQGWVIGGGIERSLSRNLVMRGEMLHYNFDDDVPVGIGSMTLDTELGSTIGRVGISYKF